MQTSTSVIAIRRLLRCNSSPFTLQFAAFYLLKGRLLPSLPSPFTAQKHSSRAYSADSLPLIFAHFYLKYSCNAVKIFKILHDREFLRKSMCK